MDISMKKMGHDLTEAELQIIMEEMDADDNGVVDFPDFLSVIIKLLNNSDYILKQLHKNQIENLSEGLLESFKLSFLNYASVFLSCVFLNRCRRYWSFKCAQFYSSSDNCIELL